MVLAAIDRRPKSLVSPEAIDMMGREDLALRLLDTAYELRTCYDALAGVEADDGIERNSVFGLKTILGRHMQAVADVAVTLYPDLAESA